MIASCKQIQSGKPPIENLNGSISLFDFNIEQSFEILRFVFIPKSLVIFPSDDIIYKNIYVYAIWISCLDFGHIPPIVS